MRRLVHAALLLAAAIPRVAVAQTHIDGFSLQQFDPSYAGDGFLAVPDAGRYPGPKPQVKLTFNYGHKSLQVVDSSTNEAAPSGVIVRHQVYLHADLSYSPIRRLELAVGLPFAAIQSGDSTDFAADVHGGKLADVRLGARVRLLGDGESRLALAAQADLWLPTGSEEDFASDGSLRAHPRLVVGGLLGGRVLYGASLGANLRPTHDVAVGELGHSLSFSGGAAVLLRNRRIWIGPEFYGATDFSERRTPVEVLVGAHMCLSASLALGLGAGTGLTAAVGVPDFRGIVGLGYEPGRCSKIPREEKQAGNPRKSEAPVPAVTRPVLLPPPDRDRDGVRDVLDACPDVVGVSSVEAAKNGCPPSAQPVAIDVAFQQQLFFRWGLVELDPASVQTLHRVAAILKKYPQITQFTIEGHADTLGDPPNNQAISEARAQAVRDWLVQRGIEPTRLTARGLGASVPVSDNDTEEGRQRNRRVVFRATLTGGAPPPSK